MRYRTLEELDDLLYYVTRRYHATHNIIWIRLGIRINALLYNHPDCPPPAIDPAWHKV